MSSTPELSTLSDDQLVAHLADLDRLFADARGDHAALADVRRQIAEQVDLVLDEAGRRGLDVLVDDIEFADLTDTPDDYEEIET